MTAPQPREHHDNDPPPDGRRRVEHGVGPTDTERAALTAPPAPLPASRTCASACPTPNARHSSR